MQTQTSGKAEPWTESEPRFTFSSSPLWIVHVFLNCMAATIRTAKKCCVFYLSLRSQTLHSGE